MHSSIHRIAENYKVSECDETVNVLEPESQTTMGAGQITMADDRFIDPLSDAELRSLAYDWRFWARPNQLLPEGDWRVWLLLGGRRAGKSRAGAEAVRPLR